MRIPVAALFLLATSLILHGNILPNACALSQILILALSGFIGLVLGDSCYFKALVILGPRLSSLMGASTPIFAVVIAWIFLDQRLAAVDLLGIALTIAGLCWVVLERNHNSFGGRPGRKWPGYLLGTCGSLGQATAITLAKVGMRDNIQPLNATFIRMAAAALSIVILARLTGIHRGVGDALKNNRVMIAIIAAAFVSPFIGVWLSLMSIQFTQIGIASTLMATTHLWVIPLVMIIHKERPSFRAIAGTIIAVAGVSILFLH